MTMIVLKRIGGTEFQAVASLDGIDTAIWQATTLTIPADMAERPYTFTDAGAQIVPKAPSPEVVAVLDVLVRADLITQDQADALATGSLT